MVVLLVLLVNLLVKDTMGSLQQNTVLNGTSLVLTWNIRMPAGKSFFAFKIYEGSLDRELAIITKESTVIRNPDRLKDRVFNDSKSDLNTVLMVFRLRIGPMALDDDDLVIMYQVIDTDAASDLSGQDTIKVTTVPYYCDSTVRLNEKYSIQRNSDLQLSTTICGNPMPTVEWKFPSWVLNGELPLLTTRNITENSKSKFVYNVTLKNVDVQNCGRNVYFNASNEYSYFTGSTTVNITGASINVTGITAKEVYGVIKCVRISFNKVDVGLCDILYQLKFVFSNATERTVTTSHTTIEDCGEGLVNSTVNVAALFNGIVGSYNDVNVNITKDLPATTATTTTTTTSGTGNPPKDEQTKRSSDNTGIIVAVVVGGLVLIIIVVIVIIMVKKKNRKRTPSTAKSVDSGKSNNHVQLVNRNGLAESDYAPNPRSNRPPERDMDPDQAVYASLGAAGGRQDPRPAPERSNYAEVKVDDMGYPVSGRQGAENVTYAALNRSGRSNPPPDDDYSAPPEDDDNAIIV